MSRPGKHFQSEPHQVGLHDTNVVYMAGLGMEVDDNMTVIKIDKGGQCDKAGIELKDVLVGFNGKLLAELGINDRIAIVGFFANPENQSAFVHFNELPNKPADPLPVQPEYNVTLPCWAATFVWLFLVIFVAYLAAKEVYVA